MCGGAGAGGTGGLVCAAPAPDRQCDSQLAAAATAEQDEWSAIQPRVWTHLSATYAEVQRGAWFLYAHEGAAERFPSLVSVSRPSAARPARPTAPEEPAASSSGAAPVAPIGTLPLPE